jgi:hypothetical protein
MEHMLQDEDDETAIAQEILDKRLSKGTRYQYNSKISALESWIRRHAKPDVRSCFDESAQKIILPLPDFVLQKFLGNVSRKKDPRNHKLLRPPQYHSYSYVNGYRSAIKELYKNENIPISLSGSVVLKDFTKGYTKMVAELKQSGDMPLFEGKRPITFNGYQYMAMRALKQERDFTLATFSHTFLLLCWNLMARSVSVGQLMFSHVSWEHDSLTITIPRHKGDQEGRNVYPRHVFANPLNPTTCPVLSLGKVLKFSTHVVIILLGIHVFVMGFRELANPMLFGVNSEHRFSCWLNHLCKEDNETLLDMGLDIVDLGTHSFRKGSATYISSNPGGPGAISIYLRAGWSIGSVSSRYIFESEGNDQFVGRAATGLNINDVQFAILPPHFDEKCTPILSREEWETILPGFSTIFPSGFRSALPFLLASIVYHSEFLIENLPSAHPLFVSRLWTTGTVGRLKSRVLTGVVENTCSGLQATGMLGSFISY